jgi:hypothetical protein
VASAGLCDLCHRKPHVSGTVRRFTNFIIHYLNFVPGSVHVAAIAPSHGERQEGPLMDGEDTVEMCVIVGLT